MFYVIYTLKQINCSICMFSVPKTYGKTVLYTNTSNKKV